jgi:phosphate-selective porin OprO/OprP
LAHGIVEYAAGVFNGSPDGAIVDPGGKSGKSFVGRVFLSPFKGGNSVLQGLRLGMAASTETQSGATVTVPSYKTGGQNVFFSYGSGVAGNGRSRLSSEMSFFRGPIGVLAEYVESKGEFIKNATTSPGGATPTVTSPFTLSNRAWQVTVSAFLTGEPARYDQTTVNRPFASTKGQRGALQLAARVNGFKADADTFTRGYADPSRSARGAAAWTVGLNWYLNRNVKQAVSFERTTFRGGAPGGANRPAENALLARAQLSF